MTTVEWGYGFLDRDLCLAGDRDLRVVLDELIASWTLVEGDWRLIRNKSGATRLGFALLLKFYELEGRFPDGPQKVPRAAVDYVASLVKVDAALFGKYRWQGRTIEYHRQQIREAFGTRPATEEDKDRWARWPAEEMCPTETHRERLAQALTRPHPNTKINRTLRPTLSDHIKIVNDRG